MRRFTPLAAALLLLGSLSAQATSTVSRTYTDSGLLASVDGPRTDVSDITRYGYDDQGHLTSVTNALNQVYTLASFDSYGNPQSLTDPNGVVTTLTYTPEGWLASTAVGDRTTQYAYNAVGDVVQITQGDGSWLKYSYDDARRLIGVSNILGESLNFTLDPMGNRTALNLKDSGGTVVRSQQQVFDELGRLLKVVGANGQVQGYGYDLNDNPASSTSPRQQTTTRAFDALNRLSQVADPLGGVTAISYNSDDQPTQVVDARAVTTQYTYDELGNLTQLQSPDSGTSHFTYDSASNLTESTDARGVVSQYRYDALNRLTALSYPATPALNVTLGYDSTSSGNFGIGRLTSVKDSSGTASYAYDNQGNLITQTRSLILPTRTVGEILRYSYDNAGQVSQITYPGEVAAYYTRNTAGQVTAVNIKVGTRTSVLASNIAYKPFGPLSNLTWANGVTLSRSFDADYRLTGQQIGTWQSNYNYDASSNITQISHSLWGTTQYDYDALERLTQEQGSSTRKAYTLDAVGNRTQRTTQDVASGSTTATQSLTYASDSNRLATLDGLAVQHDAAGNQTARDALSYSYDAQGRLSAVYQAQQKLADYAYNALGQRVSKRVYDPTTQALTDTLTYLYDQNGQLLAQIHFNGSGVRVSAQSWVWLDNLPLAQINSTYASSGSTSASKVLYLHPDHLNTPRMATDVNRKFLWSWNSDAYGVGTPNEDADGDGVAYNVDLRMPGQLWDAQSQLSYNYYRDYDAQTGRYVQSDPIGLQGGVNTYAYVMGNPLGLVDPFGLIDIPNPNGVVPGGPWEPNDAQRLGNFLAPKADTGGRAQCQFVPDTANGGPPGAKTPYWKVNMPGQKGWQRYDLSGNPITPEQAHPKAVGVVETPKVVIDPEGTPRIIRSPAAAGVGVGGLGIIQLIIHEMVESRQCHDCI